MADAGVPTFGAVESSTRWSTVRETGYYALPIDPVDLSRVAAGLAQAARAGIEANGAGPPPSRAASLALTSMLKISPRHIPDVPLDREALFHHHRAAAPSSAFTITSARLERAC